MYLAVLSDRRAAEEATRVGGDVASTVFGPARSRGLDSRQGYGWEQVADRPLRPSPAWDPLQLPQGPLAGWPWEGGFAKALVRWSSALQWVPGSGQVTYAELALDFKSHINRALPATQGHRHARQVLSLQEGTRVLREAADLLQPLLADGTVLEGSPRWMFATLVPLGGFRSMGRTERPVFACRPDMQQHMQQLQQHWLELLTRRLSTPGAGRKDHFLAGYLPRCPGGGGPARPCKIVRAQRPRVVGVARPRPPLSADIRPAPCLLGPVHLQPQCEQCTLARHGVAHYCARGHAGHPAAVQGAAASSRVLPTWLGPPEPPPEPPTKRPCVALVPAVAGPH